MECKGRWANRAGQTGQAHAGAVVGNDNHGLSVRGARARASATVMVLGVSVNGAFYHQEVNMKCPKSDEFF